MTGDAFEQSTQDPIIAHSGNHCSQTLLYATCQPHPNEKSNGDPFVFPLLKIFSQDWVSKIPPALILAVLSCVSKTTKA
jgi:hypothetical protein